MDALITVAARALTAGDPLGALNLVALGPSERGWWMSPTAPGFGLRSGDCARRWDRFARSTRRSGASCWHLFQIAEGRIQKIDPASGSALATIPAPAGGEDSGLAWAEGRLWVGHYRERKIREIDPETGEILRILESNRLVTGVTWVDGALWHGTWEGEESDLRRIDPRTGEVLEQIDLPPGVDVSGLESNGADLTRA